MRERIRINSKPISEEMFARYFFEVWDRLGSSSASSSTAESSTPSPVSDARDALTTPPRPIYARYLTLMSWHVFLQEGVSPAVYETGIGGEYDATNLVERPLATGITTLGIDHVFALGATVDKIAWHKAGIMKPRCPAFTVEQVPEAARVLEDRAVERGVDLRVVEVDPRLARVGVRPDAVFQKRNASLAVALAETALQKLGVEVPGRTEPLSREFVDGLEKVVWRGRCEVKREGDVVWHVDGAHTADSLKMAAKWFTKEISGRYVDIDPLYHSNTNKLSPGPRIIIFNQQGRSEAALDFLASIHAATQRSGKPAFDHALFCTNVTYAASGYKRDFVNRQFDPADIEAMTAQRRFADKWSALDPDADVQVLPTIEQAIDYARGLARGLAQGEEVLALVTGSLHLVGGALGILEKADAL